MYQYQQAQERGARATIKEREKTQEQKEKLSRIVLCRNKALREAYERAAHLVKRYRSLHVGSEEQMQFPPTSIPEETDFHKEFGVAVIRTIMSSDIDAIQAAQIHHQLTEDRVQHKKEMEGEHHKRAHQLYEEAQMHLHAEKVYLIT